MKNAVQCNFKVLAKKVNSSENRHSEEIEGRGHLPLFCVGKIRENKKYLRYECLHEK